LVVSQLSKKKQRQMPRYFVPEGTVANADQSKAPDTVYHQVADLVLTNQFGKTISLNNDLKGKLLVIDFFFTTCPSICPRLTGNMKVLQTMFRKDTKKEGSLDTVVQFISITINPGHDTFQVMRAYADRHGVNHDNWYFLTGDKKTIYNYARHELRLTVGDGDGGADDLIHTEQITLLDKDRHIRGYYDGLNDTSVVRCADDIVLLTMERKHKK
jgi:protein SCO1/2